MSQCEVHCQVEWSTRLFNNCIVLGVDSLFLFCFLLQFEAELKSELESVQQQAEDLARSRHKMRDELERLSEERKHFEVEKRSLREEKDKLQQTRQKLQGNTKEIDQLYSVSPFFCSIEPFWFYLPCLFSQQLKHGKLESSPFMRLN